MGIPGMLQEAMGWFHVLLALCGVGVCAYYRRRSPWAWVPLAGFGLQALVSAFMRVVTLMVTHGGFSYSVAGSFFLLGAFGSVLAQVAIIGGLAAVLAGLPESPAPPAA